MGSLHNPDDGNEELYEAFISCHEAQLRALGVPECKWRVLCRKLTSSIFDAGENFMYLEEDPFENLAAVDNFYRVYTRRSMSHEDPEHIYLIDHAWTYTLESAKRMLEENSALVERMVDILEISYQIEIPEALKIKHILHNMWQYNNFYMVRRGNQASRISCWYILDDFGSRIHFSEEPSFKMVPFLYADDNAMYSLLYPRSDVSEGEEVTVAYPGCNGSLIEDVKKALRFPWMHWDLYDYDFNLVEPSVDYFASGRQEDILPDNGSTPAVLEASSEKQLAIYSDYFDVIRFLTHPSFKIVEKKEQANILWLSEREYDIKKLVETYPNFRFISQFPSEHVLINKDLLAVICRRCEQNAFNFDTLESYPEWLPTTFNLDTELLKFVSYFLKREKRFMDNIWICKPFNLARGLGICVTDNLSQIIRWKEVGPTVVCKYISDPVLFPSEDIGLVKMDLRYIVLLRSVDPLDLYVYDRFWIRFSNKPFVLDDFSDYETHFTVMNYGDFPLQQMFCHDFIQKFEDYYTPYKWNDIQEKINNMIRDIFVAASSKEPPAGLGKFSGSRAVYGLDIMLKWDRNHDVPVMKPMILEVNWMPDCKRACQYYPEFYNDIFSVLFLGDTKDKHVVKL